MAQALTIKIAGRYSYPSDLSAVPEGALVVADNVFVDKDSIAEPRRGFDYLKHGSSVKSTFSDPSYRANKLFFYQGQLLAHYATASLAYHDSSSGWVNYTGTYTPPSATVPVRSAQANGNFYFTTANGAYRLDSYTGTPATVGVPAALDLQAAISASSSTWLANNFRTAYRVVWGLIDANNNEVLGAPSQREAITNINYSFTVSSANATAGATYTNNAQTFTVLTTISGGTTLLCSGTGAPTSGSTTLTKASGTGDSTITVSSSVGVTKAIDLTFTVPAGITTSHFYQVYRAAATAATDEPSDEMGLVYQKTVTQVDINAGTITVTDITPDTLRGATIYTAASQEGITAANYPPPTALDLAVFRSCLFYGNTTSFQTYTVTLLGEGSPNGIQANDTVTIGGVTYTAKTAETIASAQFKAFSSGSASQNIRDTALSLVRVINRYASSTVYAFYLSDVTDLPGKIMIQARTLSQGAFTVACSRAGTFNPDVGTTAGTSTNDAFKNAVFYSKTSEPEAVPLANFVYVGSRDKAILRIIALRDSLFVLKEDGIFRIYGTDPTTFEVALLDNTAILIAPETAVTQNNQIFCLSTQGVVAISENGVSIMSHAIEQDLTSLVSANYSLLQTSSFGVAYESSRAYYLFVFSSAADSGPTQYHRYNTITGTWTRGTLAKACGGVNPVDDKLYLGSASFNIIDVERKSLTYSDYADYASTQTITAVTGTLVSITSSDTIAVGSVIYQSATVFGEVVSVDPIGGTVTTSLPIAFSLASADVLAPISCTVTWVPQTFGNPGMVKHLREVAFLFKSDFNGTGTASFASDVSPNANSESIAGSQVGGWGLFAWGGPSETALGTTWGGDNRRRGVRVIVPRQQQRCTLLSVTFQHAFAYAPWQLQGISVIGEGVGERMAG